MRSKTRETSKQHSRAVQLKNAWIGDAVLTLWARQKILKEDGKLDGEKSTRMTSNQFLAVLGEPTRMEADIGVVYLQHGLEAAFNYLDVHVLPVFTSRERNWELKQSARRESKKKESVGVELKISNKESEL